LIENAKGGIKILAQGKLTLKKLKFKKVKLSDTAREEIKKAGGEILQ
jgi:ribosomal protein L15